MNRHAQYPNQTSDSLKSLPFGDAEKPLLSLEVSFRPRDIFLPEAVILFFVLLSAVASYY